MCQNYQSEGQQEASVERPKKSSEPFRVGGRLARSWTNMALLLIVPGRALECANQPCLTPNLTVLQSHSIQLVYEEESAEMVVIVRFSTLKLCDISTIHLGKVCLVLNMNSKDWR